MVVINISNKWLYSVIFIFLISSASLIAYAYSNTPNPGHGGDSIIIDINSQEKTLQQAIDEGDFSSSSGSVYLNEGTGMVLNPDPITSTGTISADTYYLQRRVSDSCSSGYAIRSVSQDGSVTCEYVGGGGGSIQLNAGTGITLNPNPITSTGTISTNPSQVQTRVSSSCSSGQAISSIGQDGSVTCESVSMESYGPISCIAEGSSSAEDYCYMECDSSIDCVPQDIVYINQYGSVLNSPPSGCSHTYSNSYRIRVVASVDTYCRARAECVCA